MSLFSSRLTLILSVLLVGGLALGTWVGIDIRSGRSMWVFNPASQGASRAKAEALPIIQALKEYHTGYNRYPDHLEQLVETGYLDVISSPSYGEGNWIYFTDSYSNTPVVGFSAVGGYPGIFFRLKTNEWTLDQ